MRFRTGVTLSQMQSGNGLRQRGQSATSATAPLVSSEEFEDVSDIRCIRSGAAIRCAKAGFN